MFPLRLMVKHLYIFEKQKINLFNNIFQYIYIYVRVMYPGYSEPLVPTQNFGYDRFPPVANSWGTIYPITGNDSTTPG
jgi:hypothetical protein